MVFDCRMANYAAMMAFAYSKREFIAVKEPRKTKEQLQRLCVAAARTELESDWCADVISIYETADRSIVAMTFAAYILWLIHRAFIQVLPSDEADALSSVTNDFSTQPWYEAHVFSRIAKKVYERMPKALSQPESAGTSIVDLIECANACGYTLSHQTDVRLMLKFEYCSIAFFTSMKELASSRLR
jgi:hypothetical protein